MSNFDEDRFVTPEANRQWREIKAELDREFPGAPGTNAFLAERRITAAIEYGDLIDRLDD